MHDNKPKSSKLFISEKLTESIELGGFIYIEGMFHMFLRNRVGAFWTIEHYISQDTVQWTRTKAVAKSVRKLGAGSVLLRGGKLYIVYKSGIRGGAVQLAISKNHTDFECVEVPAFEDKLLGANYQTPRLIYSRNEYYIVASKLNKDNNISVFGSSNGVLWEPRFEIKMQDKNKYPSIISLGGRCFLIVEDASGRVKYIEIQAEFFNRKVTFVGEWKVIEDITMPRTTVFQDGRVVLTSAIKSDDDITISTPRVLQLIDDKIAMQPLAELSFRRGEPLEITTESDNSNVIATSGWADIDIEYNLAENGSLALEFATKNSNFSVKISDSDIIYDNKSQKIGDNGANYVRIIVSCGRIEIFANAGASVISKVLAESVTKIAINGDYNKCEVMAFDINI
ncbi:MAG: hypothetical protein R3Y23_02885 [Bacillota bacterium]